MKFRVLKSKRKTLCLSVAKNGEVLVRVPLNTGEREIENFVRRHERWIASRIEKYKNRRTLDLSDGAVIVLFGKSYEIGTGSAKIGKGILFLPENRREESLFKLVRTLSKERIPPLVDETARRCGFEYSGIRISSARTRWGSCSKSGVLAFTCFLAFVDPALVAYVIVHELCHTKHFNHSNCFWREVERILPDWRVLRARLRTEEDCLNYLQ